MVKTIEVPVPGTRVKVKESIPDFLSYYLEQEGVVTQVTINRDELISRPYSVMVRVSFKDKAGRSFYASELEIL